MTFLLATVILLISLALMMMPLITSNYPHPDRENLSPFECGFDPKNTSRTPFSLQFFLIAVIFLIFDVEIALLLPMPIIINNFNNVNTLLLILFFIIILTLGLYYEWLNGALSWTL
uniref:NADH-ubiquinone oxidoreductase chain 3 n=1 Tax=Macrolenostreptus orestes TaxID=2931673 RepID=A0A8T9JBI1_9MYRI|nr:NADH dehydrogenase subunit 3 [Macrolenostreptus orestes]UOF70315.1 NADH dehydrogenase subunit 3 [Macrolenostreptus orestes]